MRSVISRSMSGSTHCQRRNEVIDTHSPLPHLHSNMLLNSDRLAVLDTARNMLNEPVNKNITSLAKAPSLSSKVSVIAIIGIMVVMNTFVILAKLNSLHIVTLSFLHASWVATTTTIISILMIVHTACLYIHSYLHNKSLNKDILNGVLAAHTCFDIQSEEYDRGAILLALVTGVEDVKDVMHNLGVVDFAVLSRYLRGDKISPTNMLVDPSNITFTKDDLIGFIMLALQTGTTTPMALVKALDLEFKAGTSLADIMDGIYCRIQLSSDYDHNTIHAALSVPDQTEKVNHIAIYAVGQFLKHNEDLSRYFVEGEQIPVALESEQFYLAEDGDSTFCFRLSDYATKQDIIEGHLLSLIQGTKTVKTLMQELNIDTFVELYHYLMGNESFYEVRGSVPVEGSQIQLSKSDLKGFILLLLQLKEISIIEIATILSIDAPSGIKLAGLVQSINSAIDLIEDINIDNIFDLIYATLSSSDQVDISDELLNCIILEFLQCNDDSFKHQYFIDSAVNAFATDRRDFFFQADKRTFIDDGAYASENGLHMLEINPDFNSSDHIASGDNVDSSSISISDEIHDPKQHTSHILKGMLLVKDCMQFYALKSFADLSKYLRGDASIDLQITGAAQDLDITLTTLDLKAFILLLLPTVPLLEIAKILSISIKEDSSLEDVVCLINSMLDKVSNVDDTFASIQDALYDRHDIDKEEACCMSEVELENTIFEFLKLDNDLMNYLTREERMKFVSLKPTKKFKVISLKFDTDDEASLTMMEFEGNESDNNKVHINGAVDIPSDMDHTTHVSDVYSSVDDSNTGDMSFVFLGDPDE